MYPLYKIVQTLSYHGNRRKSKQKRIVVEIKWIRQGGWIKMNEIHHILIFNRLSIRDCIVVYTYMGNGTIDILTEGSRIGYCFIFDFGTNV